MFSVRLSFPCAIAAVLFASGGAAEDPGERSLAPLNPSWGVDFSASPAESWLKADEVFSLQRQWKRSRLVLRARPLFSLKPDGYWLLTEREANPIAAPALPAGLVPEFSLAYERSAANGLNWHVDGSLPGPVAFGPSQLEGAFAGIEGTMQPISQPWVDPLERSFGVVTAGATRGKLSLDASLFNGRDGTRLGPLDSRAARVRLNPAPRWSLEASQGLLYSSALDPQPMGLTAASATYRRESKGRRLDLALAWGEREGVGARSDAWRFDTHWQLAGQQSLFTRYEHVGSHQEAIGETTAAARAFSFGYLYTRPLWRVITARFGLTHTLALSPEEDSPASEMAYLSLSAPLVY